MSKMPLMLFEKLLKKIRRGILQPPTDTKITTESPSVSLEADQSNSGLDDNNIPNMQEVSTSDKNEASTSDSAKKHTEVTEHDLSQPSDTSEQKLKNSEEEEAVEKGNESESATEPEKEEHLEEEEGEEEEEVEKKDDEMEKENFDTQQEDIEVMDSKESSPVNTPVNTLPENSEVPEVKHIKEEHIEEVPVSELDVTNDHIEEAPITDRTDQEALSSETEVETKQDSSKSMSPDSDSNSKTLGSSTPQDEKHNYEDDVSLTSIQPKEEDAIPLDLGKESKLPIELENEEHSDVEEHIPVSINNSGATEVTEIGESDVEDTTMEERAEDTKLNSSAVQDVLKEDPSSLPNNSDGNKHTEKLAEDEEKDDDTKEASTDNIDGQEEAQTEIDSVASNTLDKSDNIESADVDPNLVRSDDASIHYNEESATKGSVEHSEDVEVLEEKISQKDLPTDEIEGGKRKSAQDVAEDIDSFLNELKSELENEDLEAHIENAAKNEPVYIFTSLAGGGIHMPRRTNRLATILTANEIEFSYRDCGTDAEARSIWKAHSAGRLLPGVVRGTTLIGNWKEIDDANEEYRLYEMIYNSL
ncbi:dentin matrix acidic phosphoprotein 1 [Kluyveromyces marxianus]|uniref:Dentin matrix acidic phosphoprotein 1 n=1 Tax=Kluyveromyces marxianus TaxID=4911 RepID=A0ABX6EW82_KLUMA|nr:dentin matrix acidic phosphoprotein 1 [Kluyveromyces marxianus]